jgi:hypothetical protein
MKRWEMEREEYVGTASKSASPCLIRSHAEYQASDTTKLDSLKNHLQDLI